MARKTTQATFVEPDPMLGGAANDAMDGMRATAVGNQTRVGGVVIVAILILVFLKLGFRSLTVAAGS